MAGLLFPLLLLVVMYVFLILPQRRKQKAAGDLLGSLAPGDEVMTTGGIYGGVTEIDGDDLYLEIAPDVEIKINRRAVSERISATTTPAAPANDVVVPDEVIEGADPVGLPEGVSDGGDDTPEKGAKKK